MSDSRDLQFADLARRYQGIFEDYLVTESIFDNDCQEAGLQKVKEAALYTLNQRSKRFRPSLCLMTGEAIGVSFEDVLPFAMAIEMIHTYSLIHDDLPSMDDDKERRGLPTNHIKYGEDFALLAGDLLCTESMRFICRKYSSAVVARDLIFLLTSRSGLSGMVGGQSLDLYSKDKPLSMSELLKCHRLKTGSLISCCVEGALVISGKSQDHPQLIEYGESLGLAFQIKDDILDFETDDDGNNYAIQMGLKETEDLLDKLSDSAIRALSTLSSDKRSVLEGLVRFNKNRSI